MERLATVVFHAAASPFCLLTSAHRLSSRASLGDFTERVLQQGALLVSGTPANGGQVQERHHNGQESKQKTNQSMG